MEKPSPSTPDSCPICLSKIRHTASTDPCLHRFCHHCILEWSQTENTCPVCKQRFHKLIKHPRKKNRARSKSSSSQPHKSQARETANKTRDLDNQEQKYIFSLMNGPATRRKQVSFLQMYCLLEEIAEE